MSAASGTRILQDDGSVTLDEDGKVLVGAGDSDCDCCGGGGTNPCADGCCQLWSYAAALTADSFVITLNGDGWPVADFTGYPPFYDLHSSLNQEHCDSIVLQISREGSGRWVIAVNVGGFDVVFKTWATAWSCPPPLLAADYPLTDPRWFMDSSTAGSPYTGAQLLSLRCLDSVSVTTPADVILVDGPQYIIRSDGATAPTYTVWDRIMRKVGTVSGVTTYTPSGLDPSDPAYAPVSLEMNDGGTLSYWDFLFPICQVYQAVGTVPRVTFAISSFLSYGEDGIDWASVVRLANVSGADLTPYEAVPMHVTIGEAPS